MPQTALFWHKKQTSRKWNRMENTEKNHAGTAIRFLMEGLKIHAEQKTGFLGNGAGKTTSIC